MCVCAWVDVFVPDAQAPDIWPRWTVGNGNGLHPLQLKIAMRAAQLLKIGGRLVYSTCTFNPIEAGYGSTALTPPHGL